MTLFAERLSLARRLRGASRRELAQKIGVTDATFSYWESGRNEPTPERLRALATVLRVPEAFFARHATIDVPSDTVSFRSLRTLTRRDRDRACATAEIATELSMWIAQRYRLPEPSVPDLSDAPPELAAAELRRHLRVGNDPMPSMLAILESLGIRCFSLGADISKADALSTWAEGTPLVLFNVAKSAERSRNDAAHELGHLCLHRHRAPAGDKAEQEAIAFAAELLLPREAITRESYGTLSLSSLLQLKFRWGVSAAFMLKRLTDLDRVTTWTARALWQQLSSAGYRSGEPDGMPREVSQVLSQVIAHQRTKHRRPFGAIAQELNLSPLDVRARFDGLLELSVQEGGGDEELPAAHIRPHLQLLS